jgi:hypothetical protein
VEDDLWGLAGLRISHEESSSTDSARTADTTSSRRFAVRATSVIRREQPSRPLSRRACVRRGRPKVPRSLRRLPGWAKAHDVQDHPTVVFGQRLKRLVEARLAVVGADDVEPQMSVMVRPSAPPRHMSSCSSTGARRQRNAASPAEPRRHEPLIAPLLLQEPVVLVVLLLSRG